MVPKIKLFPVLRPITISGVSRSIVVAVENRFTVEIATLSAVCHISKDTDVFSIFVVVLPF